MMSSLFLLVIVCFACCFHGVELVAGDSAFSHTILDVFQTATGPPLSSASQLAFDAVHRRLLVGDSYDNRLVSFNVDVDSGSAPDATAGVLHAPHATGVAMSPNNTYFWVTSSAAADETAHRVDVLVVVRWREQRVNCRRACQQLCVCVCT